MFEPLRRRNDPFCNLTHDSFGDLNKLHQISFVNLIDGPCHATRGKNISWSVKDRRANTAETDRLLFIVQCIARQADFGELLLKFYRRNDGVLVVADKANRQKLLDCLHRLIRHQRFAGSRAVNWQALADPSR